MICMWTYHQLYQFYGLSMAYVHHLLEATPVFLFYPWNLSGIPSDAWDDSPGGFIGILSPIFAPGFPVVKIWSPHVSPRIFINPGFVNFIHPGFTLFTIIPCHAIPYHFPTFNTRWDANLWKTSENHQVTALESPAPWAGSGSRPGPLAQISEDCGKRWEKVGKSGKKVGKSSIFKSKNRMKSSKVDLLQLGWPEGTTLPRPCRLPESMCPTWEERSFSRISWDEIKTAGKAMFVWMATSES